MQAEETLNLFWKAISASGQARPYESGERKALSLEAAENFSDQVGPDFYASFNKIPERQVVQFLKHNNLFTDRRSPFRAVFGESDKAVSSQELKTRMTEAYGSSPPELASCLTSMKKAFFSCSLRTEAKLISTLQQAESQARSFSPRAWGSFQTILASKPYTRDLEKIGNETRKEFFTTVAMKATRCSISANTMSLGAQIASRALHSRGVQQRAATERIPFYLSCVSIISSLAQKIERELAADTMLLLSSDLMLLSVLQEANSLWNALCAESAALGAPLAGVEVGSDSEKVALAAAVKAAQKKLLALKKLATPPFMLTEELNLMPFEPAHLESDDIPGRIRPWRGNLDDYSPWPDAIKSLFNSSQLASQGIYMPARNYLLVSSPGTGKTTFCKAFFAECARRKAVDPTSWPFEIKGFSLPDSSALGGHFDESRSKINDYLQRLVKLGHQEKFVPFVVIEEVQKFLNGSQDPSTGAGNENARIGYAFTQWMDNSDHDLEGVNNLFFLCTTNDSQHIMDAAWSRFAGNVIRYQTPSEVKWRKLQEYGLVFPTTHSNEGTIGSTLSEVMIAAAMLVPLRELESLASKARKASENLSGSASSKREGVLDFLYELLRHIPVGDECSLPNDKWLEELSLWRRRYHKRDLDLETLSRWKKKHHDGQPYYHERFKPVVGSSILVDSAEFSGVEKEKGHPSALSPYRVVHTYSHQNNSIFLLKNEQNVFLASIRPIRGAKPLIPFAAVTSTLPGKFTDNSIPIDPYLPAYRNDECLLANVMEKEPDIEDGVFQFRFDLLTNRIPTSLDQRRIFKLAENDEADVIFHLGFLRTFKDEH